MHNHFYSSVFFNFNHDSSGANSGGVKKYIYKLMFTVAMRVVSIIL